jgi:hypothetical protein
MAAAALVVPLLVVASRQTHGSAWMPRGAQVVHSLGRDVGVTVYRGTAHLDVLEPGDLLARDAALSVSVRAIGPSGDHAFVMAFAQDVAGAVHWIEPPWLDASEDPKSPPIAPAAAESPPTSAMAFDDLAEGELHVFTLVTAEPLRVSDVERIAPDAITREALLARWPAAVVDDIPVRIVGRGGGR